MQTLTYTNNHNGLSITFSSDNPQMFLEHFDGSSAGADAITYKPLAFDGQRLITTSLSARTITAVINIAGKDEKGYSREAAKQQWLQLQKVLIPGDMGRLTYTSDTGSYFIDCRVESTPMPSEKLPFLISAAVNFIADKPYWYETEEQVLEITQGTSFTYHNDCGFAVPFIYEIETGSEPFEPWLFLIGYQSKEGCGLALFDPVPANSRCVINTEDCTVTLYEGGSSTGVLSNHLLSVDSTFGYLQPGDNMIWLAFYDDSCRCRIRWHRAYLGVM